MQTKTLRDEFAMAALTGLASDVEVGYERTAAEWAYKMADKMLEARDEGDSPSPDLTGELVAALEEFCEYTTLEGYRQATERARAVLAKVPAETTNQEG